jgi:large subunit ribosomal protein L25
MDLAVQVRELKGKKLKNVRKEDQVPCVVYGKYIDAPMSLMCQKQEFIKAYKSAGYSMPLTLKGDGIEQLVLIHDIQVDPVTDYVLHVDFLTLKQGQKVETEVQIILQGVAPIEKLGLGKVQLVKNAVSIEAFPKDLPHDIKVDISSLTTVNDVIFVKDLVV